MSMPDEPIDRTDPPDPPTPPRSPRDDVAQHIRMAYNAMAAHLRLPDDDRRHPTIEAVIWRELAQAVTDAQADMEPF